MSLLCSPYGPHSPAQEMIGSSPDALTAAFDLMDYFATRNPAGWFQVEAGTMGYSSHQVLEALIAAEAADQAAEGEFHEVLRALKSGPHSRERTTRSSRSTSRSGRCSN